MIRQRPDSIITAPADKVTPLQFLDALTGRNAETRAAERRQLYEDCKAAIRRGNTYGWPPVMVDMCRAEMEAEEALTAKVERDLSFTMKKDAA